MTLTPSGLSGRAFFDGSNPIFLRFFAKHVPFAPLSWLIGEGREHPRSFERICISRWLCKNHPDKFRPYAALGDAIGSYLSPASWRCTRIWGATLGLPLSLAGISAVLHLDEQKMTEGKALIRYFCTPLRHLPSDAPEKWALFKSYNRRDVEVTLRQDLAKSSVKKYQAMATAVCADGRARGMFQFYGATRTGRWSGHIIQLQNLRRNTLEGLAEARELVRDGNFEAIERRYGSVPEVLSQLVRTAFIPRNGCKFIVADFSAIEARVLSFLAGEAWRLKVFAENGDIYSAAASRMFGVPVEKHGINGELRQKGKIAELALGYGGSVGALKAMGAEGMSLEEFELQPLVDAWREANPNIVAFWWAVDRAVKQAVQKHLDSKLGPLHFAYQSGFLFITLPSGCKLAYIKPRLGINRFGGESVTYEGIGLTKKWERLESYGPKFVENIVQATSRDILMYAMKTLHREYICAHVHDELIIECEKNTSVAQICEQMSRTPPWMPALLLRADGYECTFYQKD